MVGEHLYYKVKETLIAEGKGVHVSDNKGKTYIDCVSGTFNLSLGHNHPEVIAAVKAQMDKLTFATSLLHSELLDQLADALIEIAPSNLQYAHLRNTGGSTANEGAIRIAQYISGKQDIISMFRGHIGQTIAGVSVGGFAFRRAPFPQTLSGIVHVPAPYCYRCFYDKKPESCHTPCVSKIADFIKYASTGRVACLIIEPIFGVGGNFFPPKKYFHELKTFCEENDILLIFDEVQTGFGRTGQMFAADYFGVSPHLMTLAKGMTGTGFPLGAILTESKLQGMGTEYHSFTNCGCLASVAAAIKTIEIIKRPGFLEQVREVGQYLITGLTELKKQFDFIGDVRGVGLMIGVEINDKKGKPDNTQSIRLIDAMFEVGLISRLSEYGHGNVIKFRPPLILTKQEAEQILARFEEACHAC